MARQIKLRRDQQKARKAQQIFDDIEQVVRKSIDFDILPLKSLKKPQKLSTPKKTSKARKTSNQHETTQLLRNQIEKREMAKAMDKEKGDQRHDGIPQMPLPIPIPMHPLFRQFKPQNGYVFLL